MTSYRSLEPGLYHRLESFIVWIADTSEKIFPIQKEIIVTVSQVSAVCRVILLYEARVVNSLLGNFNVAIGLQCQALPNLGEIFGARSQAPHIRTPQVVNCKNCLTFYKDDGYR